MLEDWFGAGSTLLKLKQFAGVKYTETSSSHFLEGAKLCVQSVDSVQQPPVKALLKDYLKLRELSQDGRNNPWVESCHGAMCSGPEKKNPRILIFLLARTLQTNASWSCLRTSSA